MERGEERMSKKNVGITILTLVISTLIMVLVRAMSNDATTVTIAADQFMIFTMTFVFSVIYGSHKLSHKIMERFEK